jgi:hypothetical protein
MSFETPILFLIFNRPVETLRVFNEIKKQKPKYLYIAADGPRESKKRESELCKQTRDIINYIDWDCELKTLFREENLGCGKAISSAINWFFDNVESGIILEDDCLPNETFFTFCREMLLKYKDDNRIGMISGDNFLPDKFNVEHSYYFSQFPHIWGWATWSRAWKKYDFEMTKWLELEKKDWLYRKFSSATSRYYWKNIFDKVFKKQIDTWDYQWAFTCFNENYLSIIPKKNLISNIGFGNINATHTNSKGGRFANMKTFAMVFPLNHPLDIVKNQSYDSYIQSHNFVWWKMLIKNIFPRNILRLIKR